MRSFSPVRVVKNQSSELVMHRGDLRMQGGRDCNNDDQFNWDLPPQIKAGVSVRLESKYINILSEMNICLYSYIL